MRAAPGPAAVGDRLPGRARVKLALVLVTLLLLHTTLFVELRVADVMPDVMLLAAVSAGLVAGPVLGAEVGFASGLMADLFLATPMGLSALVLCLLGYATGVARSGLHSAPRLFGFLAAFVASAVGVAAFALAGATLGEAHLLSGHLWVVMAVVAAGNTLLAPVVVRAVGWAVGGPARMKALA